MKNSLRLFKPFWALALSLAVLAGCANETSSESTSNAGGVYTTSTSGGIPTNISISQVDHIDPPEDFDARKVFKNEDAEQDKKFIFDAKPGETIGIENPSEGTISSEEIERALTVKDAYAEKENKGPVMLKSNRSPNKKFRLADPKTKRTLRSIAPHQHALLELEEPTEGGDLTIYEKDGRLPINFEGKSTSVNELIVATTRPDVEEFDPNTEIPGYLYDKVADYGDLSKELEGSFLYKEDFGLKEGDQFYLGENQTFDQTSTYHTFLSSSKEGDNYRIRYTVPDYGVCFNKFNVHQQDRPIDLESPEASIKMPTNEELVRELDKEGGIIDIVDREVLPQAMLADPTVAPLVRRAFEPTLNVTLSLEKVAVNATISVSIDGNVVVTNWSLTVTYGISTSGAGTIALRVGCNMYFRKTLSTYMDYKIRYLPYPKLKYVCCVKSYDELSVIIAAGVAGQMKTDKGEKDDYDPGKQMEELKDKISGLFAKKGGEGGAKALRVPAPRYKDGDFKTGDLFTDNLDGFDVKEAKFVGDGIVVAGPRVTLVLPYVNVELGVSWYFTPTIQGKFFWSYNQTSTTINCKVVSGFDEPEGYGDDVEESRSYHTVGLIAQIGIETGFIVELSVYPTGCRDIFRASVAFTMGLSLQVSGVVILTWGDEIDFQLLGYVKIELSLVFKVSVRLNILNGKFLVDLKTWSWSYPLLSFGGNLHFIDFVDDRSELDWSTGKYININEMGILDVVYFSSDNMTVGSATCDWKYEAFFASGVVKFKARLFEGVEILEGKDYVSFNDDKSCFEVNDSAPSTFSFKFKILTNGWLGISMPDKTITVHYLSNTIRHINFIGYTGEKKEIDGAHLGGGSLTQGEVYIAPEMPPQEDGTPFYGWIGDNGLYLQPNERMSVGTVGITFRPIYRAPSVYVVNFYDGNNNLIISEKIIGGGSADEPADSIRDAKMGDAKFLGWDRDFSDIRSNINVYGIYAKGGKAA